MNKIKFSLNKRLSTLNQRTSYENMPGSTLLFAALIIVSSIYFIVAFSLFHTLWYHKLFAVISTLIFAYSIQDLYFEHVEKKVKEALPTTTKKLSHYYTHYQGNVIPAMKETEEKCPNEARYYIIKIRKALISNNMDLEVTTLKRSFPFVWYRMLISILYMAKKKGKGIEKDADGTVDYDNANLIGKNLMKITNIVNFINVQQGYNDAELKYIQLFLYFSPVLFIFASDWINAKILIEMNMQEVYQGIKAQNIKSYLFMAANLSALFIHWMRKQQL